MSLVTGSIREPGEYSSGTPLMDNRSWRRNAVRFKQLDKQLDALARARLLKLSELFDGLVHLGTPGRQRGAVRDAPWPGLDEPVGAPDMPDALEHQRDGQLRDRLRVAAL